MRTARLILTGNHEQAVEKVVARADNLAESMWLKGEGLFSHNKIIPEPVERQRLSNFVRQTRMATACIEAPAKLPAFGSRRRHRVVP